MVEVDDEELRVGPAPAPMKPHRPHEGDRAAAQRAALGADAVIGPTGHVEPHLEELVTMGFAWCA